MLIEGISRAASKRPTPRILPPTAAVHFLLTRQDSGHSNAFQFMNFINTGLALSWDKEETRNKKYWVSTTVFIVIITSARECAPMKVENNPKQAIYSKGTYYHRFQGPSVPNLSKSFQQFHTHFGMLTLRLNLYYPNDKLRLEWMIRFVQDR